MALSVARADPVAHYQHGSVFPPPMQYGTGEASNRIGFDPYAYTLELSAPAGPVAVPTEEPYTPLKPKPENSGMLSAAGRQPQRTSAIIDVRV